MPRLRLPNYPEKEYFAHRFTFSDKMARAATRISKKTGPLPNLPDKLWWRRGSSRGGARRRENGPVNRFQREGGEAGFASPYSPRLGWPHVTAKRQVRCRTCLIDSGGGAENRTPVHTRSPTGPYKLVQRFEFRCETPVGGLLCILAGSIFA